MRGVWAICGLLALAGCGEGDLIGCPPAPGTYHLTLRVTKNDGCQLKAQTVETDVQVTGGDRCGVEQLSRSFPAGGGCTNSCLMTVNIQRDSVSMDGRCSVSCPSGGSCSYSVAGSAQP